MGIKRTLLEEVRELKNENLQIKAMLDEANNALLEIAEILSAEED